MTEKPLLNKEGIIAAYPPKEATFETATDIISAKVSQNEQGQILYLVPKSIISRPKK